MNTKYDAEYLNELFSDPKTRKLAYRLFSVVEDAHIECEQADQSPVDLSFQLCFAVEVISHMLMTIVFNTMIEGGYPEEEALRFAMRFPSLAEDIAMEDYEPDMLSRVKNAIVGVNVNGPEPEA